MPNDLPVGKQDAFFWMALEEIARTMNLMISEENRRLQSQRGSGSG